MAISFGVTVLPDPPHTRFLELLELAEEQGFDYGWTYDSPVLWEESVRRLLELGCDRFVEVGPGKVLSGLLRQIDRRVLSSNVEDSAGLEKLLAQRAGREFREAAS